MTNAVNAPTSGASQFVSVVTANKQELMCIGLGFLPNNPVYSKEKWTNNSEIILSKKISYAGLQQTAAFSISINYGPQQSLRGSRESQPERLTEPTQVSLLFRYSVLFGKVLDWSPQLVSQPLPVLRKGLRSRGWSVGVHKMWVKLNLIRFLVLSED